MTIPPRTRLALLAGFFFCSSSAWSEVSWKNGEELTYEVHWGMVTAAEAKFTATRDGTDWILKLDLKSLGVLNKVNPIRSEFTSRMQTEPWHSLSFEEDRSEGSKKKKNRTVLNYSSLKGHHEDLLAKMEADFELPRAEMDDAGSLLYAIREQDWRKEKERTIVSYDGGKIKYGRARLIKETREAVGIWPSQKLLVVEAWPEDENGVRKKGSLRLWISDDEKRVPLRAEFVARFGTFQIELVNLRLSQPASGGN